jgi:hypothetical protein
MQCSPVPVQYLYLNDILLVNADKLVCVINVADKLFTCHETTINIYIYIISLPVIHAVFCLGVVFVSKEKKIYIIRMR